MIVVKDHPCYSTFELIHLSDPANVTQVVNARRTGGGGIIGASGLLLGIGKLRGLEGACFMGETPGYLVDPNSAKAVLKILMKITNIEVDLSRLEEKAKEIEYIAQQLSEMEGMGKERDDLQYIG